MKTILIVESNAPEAVDYNRSRNMPIAADTYAAALRANAAQLTVKIVEPYRTPLTQNDLEGIDGIALTGSGVPWSVEAPEAAVLRSAGEMVLKSGLPVIGSCNGLQLAALLLGGKIGASPNGLEVGLARDIKITPEGRTHPMMATRSDGFCVPCVHRDEVQQLPSAATLIAYNDHCPVQAMVYQANGVDYWGMQYHPEMPIHAVADCVLDTSSIFSESLELAKDLRCAESDLDAAARLGGKPEEMAEKIRTTELANWLSHIKNTQA